MATTAKPAQVELLASKWHSAGLLLIILSSAVIGRIFVPHQSAAILEQWRTRIYLLGLIYEWFLFVYVWLGLRRQVKTARRVIDESSWTLGRLGVYALIAVGIALAWTTCGFVIGRLFPPGADEIRHLQSLFPHGAEKVLWVVLSVSAGFCEEFVYRGYLQQQFHRLTGSLSAGVVLQALAYGIAHAALPLPIVASVICLGLILGGVAAWRRSLVPGMLQHGIFDSLAGLFSF